MNNRTQYTAEYKASVVLRVLREEETVAEIAATEGPQSGDDQPVESGVSGTRLHGI